MAMIQCPECGREISDTAVSCPHCGYELKERRNKVRETELGPVVTNKPMALFEIILGIFVFLPGSFILFVMTFVLGIIGLFSTFAIFVDASNKITGWQSGTCPYCGNSVNVRAKEETCKCMKCKKISTKRNGYLATID